MTTPDPYPGATMAPAELSASSPALPLPENGGPHYPRLPSYQPPPEPPPPIHDSRTVLYLARHPVLAILAVIAALFGTNITSNLVHAPRADISDDVSSALRPVTDRLGELEDTVQRVLDQHEAKLDAGDARLQRLEAALERINQYHATVDSHFRDHADWQRDLQRRVDKLER